MMPRNPTALRAIARFSLPISGPRPVPSVRLAPQSPSRALSSTPSLLKKRKTADQTSQSSHSASGSSSRKHAPELASASASASGGGGGADNAPDPENPLDMSALTGAYAVADAHFRAEIQQVLHGGRFNPDSLGSVPVTLKQSSLSPSESSSSSSHSSSSSSSSSSHHGSANSTTTSKPSSAHETFHLRELAQIVPRPGRTISLLVNDKKYIKDIMSAIQKSDDFNQQPQRSQDNELELLLKVELERKDDLARRIRDACRAWRDRVRQARTRHEKTLQEWKKTKAVLPDVVRKAEREMQKVQDKKMKELDQEEAQALKQLDRH